MKRLGLFVAVGALILGWALPALAQQSNQPTVTFTGQIRFVGVAWNNLEDFTDTKVDRNKFKDSQQRFFERLRYWMTVESADKKAKAVWNFQVGDLTLGAGDGVSAIYPNRTASNAGGTIARTGTGAGGAAGARGVNMQNRQLYIEFEDPFSGLAEKWDLGIHYVQFLDGPFNEFYADNNGGISMSWKADPIDLNVWWVKIGKGGGLAPAANSPEQSNFVSDRDNDFYAARVGVSVTPDIRVTGEVLLANTNCYAVRPAGTPNASGAGSCVDKDFGNTYWFGGTVNAKIGDIKLYGVGVYGSRPLYSAALDKQIKESGYGFSGTATLPLGPLTVNAHGWYTSGDKQRMVGGNNTRGTCTSKAQPVLPAGVDCSGNALTTLINKDSDKLPVPISGSSWGNMPYIAEALFGQNTLGGPTGLGQPLGADISGTYGVGGSVKFALTPSFNLNGGVAFVGSSETKNLNGGKNAIFGDHVFEIDAGPTITVNANVGIQVVASYLIPDTGDNAWAIAWRTIFSF